MDVLIVFVNRGSVGNTRGKFRHFPPTIQDVRDMEKELNEKFGFGGAVIVNWLPISEEEEEYND